MAERSREIQRGLYKGRFRPGHVDYKTYDHVTPSAEDDANDHPRTGSILMCFIEKNPFSSKHSEHGIFIYLSFWMGNKTWDGLRLILYPLMRQYYISFAGLKIYSYMINIGDY